MESDAVNDAFAQVVAKAWTDESFKAALIAAPAATLKEVGIEIADGVTLKVVEDTETVVNLVLPRAPKEGELSDELLEGVSGGVAPLLGVAASAALKGLLAWGSTIFKAGVVGGAIAGGAVSTVVALESNRD